MDTRTCPNQYAPSTLSKFGGIKTTQEINLICRCNQHKSWSVSTWGRGCWSLCRSSKPVSNFVTSYFSAFPIWATSWENLFMPYENNKGADQHLFCLLPRVYNIFSFYVRNFKPLASFCGCAGWFESCLFEYPKDRFSLDEAHLIVPEEGCDLWICARSCENVSCHMRTTKVQISLRIRAVWSAPLLFAA